MKFITILASTAIAAQIEDYDHGTAAHHYHHGDDDHAHEYGTGHGDSLSAHEHDHHHDGHGGSEYIEPHYHDDDPWFDEYDDHEFAHVPNGDFVGAVDDFNVWEEIWD